MQNRGNFPDLYLADALPAIRDIIYNEYQQYKSVIGMVFNRDTTSRSIEQSTGVSGLGRFVETDEGEEHATDVFIQRFDKTYVPSKFTLGYFYTKELVDDDEYGLVSHMSKALGKSAFDTQETHGAELYNDAFTGASFVGGDGLALCSASHPTLAGTSSNLASTPADLDPTSLQQATIELEATTDEQGLLVFLQPKYLLVPKEERFNAYQLLKSSGLPGTADNDVNSLVDIGLSPIVWRYLTDPDAWFIIGSTTDIHWYDRYSFSVENYPKPSVQGHAVYGYMKYSRGFNDWRGVFGNAGA